MMHGLLWLPLLAVFIGLAWAGWNEYQKVEAYRLWAQGFERAKYDILAVVGQKDDQLTWGTPTRIGILNSTSLSLRTVRSVQLLVDEQPVSLDNPPTQGQAAIELVAEGDRYTIPFTEVALAAQWAQYLQQTLKALQATS